MWSLRLRNENRPRLNALSFIATYVRTAGSVANDLVDANASDVVRELPQLHGPIAWSAGPRRSVIPLLGQEAGTNAQRIYNSLFPYSVEVCAVTQLHQIGAKPGGWGGHATLFINGAEIDSGASYPRLRLLAKGADLSGADSGVGISVNKVFDNVTWVAVPGRDEFFRGRLATEQLLDKDVYEAAIRRAATSGWFAGVGIKDAVMRQRPPAVRPEEFIARHSIGTDFALNFARTAYCARLPVSRDALTKVVDYLNSTNESAQKSGYTWNMYTNNCSHVAHNALAAAGVWDPKVARGPGAINVARDVVSVARALALSQMSDFSFPANSFVRLYEAGNERPIDDALAAFRNHDVRRTMGDGWMTTGPGALIAAYPIHDAGRNQMFALGRDPFLFSVPMLWDKADKFKMLTGHAPSIVTDLDANLATYRERYAKTLSNQRTVDDELASLGVDGNGHDFRTFYGHFYEHIAGELERTDARIGEYRRLVDYDRAGSPSPAAAAAGEAVSNAARNDP
jgi:hypothetical protein